jgi:3',5'-cyclic AMP phosphodiesterase CpdA
MELIHLSDLHFGDTAPPFCELALAEALSLHINNCSDVPVLIISGDITIKGQSEGYVVARNFISVILDRTNIPRSSLIICPGNHDIVNQGFEEFSNFVYGARRDNNLDFTKGTFYNVVIDEMFFLIANSSFHLNHKFGMVDDKCFMESFSEFEGMKKVFVLHHHILNHFDDDTSAVRNSYELVKFLDTEGFSLVLHGHQHIDQLYYLGKNSTPVISARSGNFNQSGYLNAFNHYKLLNDDIVVTSYVFENDKSSVKIRDMGEVYV